MKILALDSSGLVASAAIVEDQILVAEYTIHHKKTHSQTLLPMLDEISKMTELALDTIDAIAVAAGPGSFTGLRIGSATAKGLGLALNKPLIGIPTLEGLAYQLYGTDKLVCPIMDARRNQVYTGIYQYERKQTEEGMGFFELKALHPQFAEDIQNVIELLNKENREVVFLGDGVPVFQQTILQDLKVPFSFAPAHMNRQRAGCIGALAIEYYKKGCMEDAAMHEPVYLRLSQAERERMEEQNHANT